MQHTSPYTSLPNVGPVARAARSYRLRVALLATLMLALGLLFWPVQVHGASAADQPVLLSAAELQSITGGCTRDCDGGGSGGGGGGGGRDSSAPPEKVGRPYWEISHSTLISRTSPSGSLVWHRKNSTNQTLGPITVEYTKSDSLDWSISGGVPSGVVSGSVGSKYSKSLKVTSTYSIPPRTYYKLYVAYPTERRRHYFYKWQDYDDNSRSKLGSSTVTSTRGWTLTNLVEGPVN